MQYYIFVNGTRLGPYSKEELRLQGITPESIVWRPGLQDWMAASALPDLADLLADSAFGAYAEKLTPPTAQEPQQAPSQYPNQPYNNPSYPNQPYNNPGYPNQAYNNPTYPNTAQGGVPPYNPYNQNYNPMPLPHTNWMPWAIIATIIGFCTSCIAGIFGIIGIVNASKANTAYANGMKEEGDSNNATAKIMVIISLVLDVLGIAGVITYFWVSPL